MQPNGIRRGIRRLFRLSPTAPAEHASEIEDELRFHVDARVEQLVAQGMPEEAARAEAHRRLGIEPTQLKTRAEAGGAEAHRRRSIRDHMLALRYDIQHAARALLRRPGFSLIAILTLGIGIGATTAIFSAVNTLILRPLPFSEPDKLMRLMLLTPQTAAAGGDRAMVWSYPKYQLFRDAQRSFESTAIYAPEIFTLTGPDAERVAGETVSANYLSTVGLRTQLGRDFGTADELTPGAPRIAVIGDAMWKRRFNADSAVLGRTLLVNNASYEIVGVAPQAFMGLSGQADIFVPLLTRAAQDLSEPYSHEFSLIGRLKPGMQPAQAASEMQAIGARIHATYPGSGSEAWSATAQPLNSARIAPQVRRSMFILFGAVGCLLLVACVNIANLMLGQAAARRREIAVRLALGASRARLIRMLLSESVLLSLAGATAGILIAIWGTQLLSAINPISMLRVAGVGLVSFKAIGIDSTALLFTLVVAIVTGVAFGLAPAFTATRATPAAAMRGQRSSGSGVRTPMTGRNLLVIAEVATAVVLLAGAGLMLRSLQKLMAVDVGFIPQNVVTARFNIPPGSMARDSLPGFYESVLERVRATPGVAAVALGNCAPLTGGCNATRVTFPDNPAISVEQGPLSGVHWISKDWFDVLRVPLVAGRLFEASDDLRSQRVVLVNETAAQKFWPGADAVGKRIAVWQGGFQDGATVIGVVRDVRFATADAPPGPDVFLPVSQSVRPGLIVYAKTAGAPETMLSSLRTAMREAAPGVPVYDVQTLTARTSVSIAPSRFSATLLGIFAAVALLLALIGVYGVMSFLVMQRRQEIGVRLALGAQAGDVARLVLRRALLLGLTGAAVGVVAALQLTGLLRTLLFEVDPRDTGVFAGMIVLLVVAVLAASWIPARRAARTSPMESIRAG